MRLKKFSLMLLIIMFSVSMLFAMGSSEQAKPESGVTESQPSQEQRVVPDSKGELFFSFSGITKKVLPSVVELDVVEVVRQETTPFNFLNPFDFFFGGGRGSSDHSSLLIEFFDYFCSFSCSHYVSPSYIPQWRFDRGFLPIKRPRPLRETFERR